MAFDSVRWAATLSILFIVINAQDVELSKFFLYFYVIISYLICILNAFYYCSLQIAKKKSSRRYFSQLSIICRRIVLLGMKNQ